MDKRQLLGSLFTDHQCGKDKIPSQTLQILQEHSDEVWFLQFSHNGKYLASSSSDCLVIIWERHLLDFVYKAFVEDIIPILVVAFHCQLVQLLSYCVQRLAQSDLEKVVLEKEVAHEVLCGIQSLLLEYQKSGEHASLSVDPVNEKRIERIHKALDGGLLTGGRT